MSEILYHYCSVDGFFNIINRATIWLSDVCKSNDYRECILCRDRIDEKIEEMMEENDDCLKAWKLGTTLRLGLNRELYTYCACFSESCDQLSQWRGYASDGKGISIGFDKKLLAELSDADEYMIAFAPIIYNKKEQDEYIEELVEDNLKKIEYKSILHVAAELHTNYRLKFPFIKHSSFEEEKEWRIVISSRPGVQQLEISDNFDFSEVKYRVSNEKLISYIEMSFSKIKKELIKEIWIGPKSEIEINDVVSFLNACGYYEGVAYNSSEPILIRKSESSYR